PALLGGGTLRNFAQPRVAHDCYANTRTDRCCPPFSLPRRRRRASGGTVYWRRNLLRAGFRRIGGERDYLSTQRRERSGSCRRLLRRACQTLSRAALDQSSRPSCRIISARRVGALGSGTIPTRAASASNGQNRAMIWLCLESKLQGE